MRFYYYGFMLNRSPYRVRRDVLNGLRYEWDRVHRTWKRAPSYWGPTTFQAKINYSDRKEAEQYVKNFPQAFPKFAGGRPSLDIIESPAYGETKQGEPYETTDYDVEVKIPKRCRMSATVEDIDYSAPVWLNLGSLAVFFLYHLFPTVWNSLISHIQGG